MWPDSKFSVILHLPGTKGVVHRSSHIPCYSISTIRYLFYSLILLFTAQALRSQSASFSYSSPVCANYGPQTPTLSSGFPTGGFYSASPPGLNLNSSNGQITASLSSPGSYQISYAGSTCNCVITSTLVIYPLPTVSIVNTTACAGGESSVTIAASPSTGLTYTWLPSGPNTYSNSIPISQLNQTHTVVVTDANGCSNKAVKNGTLLAPQPISISGTNTACQGSTVTLTASGASSYTWSTGAFGSVTTVTAQGSGTYSVTAKDFQGCITTAIKNIVVITPPDFAVTQATLCAGRQAKLFATSQEELMTYQWQPGNLSGDSVLVSPMSTFIYTVEGKFMGCGSKKYAVVTVVPSYTAETSFHYNGPLCSNSSDPMPVVPTSFVTGGVWISDLPIDSVTGKLTLTAGSEGQHFVTYSVATKGCTFAPVSAVQLTIQPATPADLPPVIKIKEGTSIQLSISNSEALVWSPPLWLSCSDCDSPVASPPQTQKYCAEGHVNGCWAGVCTIIEVICDNPGDFSVPNAFTPNKDGKNEKFCLKGWAKCTKNFSVRIYSRWGEEVFYSTDPNFCWDGTHNGAQLNADVFVYVMRVTYNDDPELVKKGNITLIR
jgi:gliding motility-associated-like protein